MKVEGLKGVIWKTQNTYEVHKVQKAHFEKKNITLPRFFQWDEALKIIYLCVNTNTFFDGVSGLHKYSFILRIARITFFLRFIFETVRIDLQETILFDKTFFACQYFMMKSYYVNTRNALSYSGIYDLFAMNTCKTTNEGF